ncbi:MAG: hypothetical protein O7D95_05135 [Betaproteobacteria bacterium]|nr:hypothetical protein [Betaproteobacteria bacterium]
MKNVIFALLTIVLLVGCVTGHLVQVSDTQTLGPKIIALDAPRVPWAIEIKNHLRDKGFKVLRWSTKTRVIEQTKSESVEQFNKFEVEYVLVIEGFAPYDWEKRWAGKCIKGCYNFVRISADLVNTTTNKTIFNVSGSGYSEKCHPISGSIFSDIANAVNDAWD